MWKVVPLSKGQLLDVRPEDVLHNGLFRRCETYRGGGGYDRFPYYAQKRWGLPYHRQFIVQLFGCNLDCTYCYVTRAGVWGKYVGLDTGQLWQAFLDSGQDVFHLMGGAPALYMPQWPDLLERVEPPFVFHSDLMLTEREYDRHVLQQISHPRALYAVNVKGTTAAEHLLLTRKPLNESRMMRNLTRLCEEGTPFYVTFTGVDPARAAEWAELYVPQSVDWYVIDLIEYEAVAFVDEVPWGPQVR